MDLETLQILKQEFYSWEIKESKSEYYILPICIVGLLVLPKNAYFSTFLTVTFQSMKKAETKYFSGILPQLLTLNQKMKQVLDIKKWDK